MELSIKLVVATMVFAILGAIGLYLVNTQVQLFGSSAAETTEGANCDLLKARASRTVCTQDSITAARNARDEFKNDNDVSKCDSDAFDPCPLCGSSAYSVC